VLFLALVGQLIYDSIQEDRRAEAAQHPVTAAQMGIKNRSKSTFKWEPYDKLFDTGPSTFSATMHVDVTNTSDKKRKIEVCGPYVSYYNSVNKERINEPGKCESYVLKPHSRLRAKYDGGDNLGFGHESGTERVDKRGYITSIDYHPVKSG